MVGQKHYYYGVDKEYALNFVNGHLENQERDHYDKFCVLWLH